MSRTTASAVRDVLRPGTGGGDYDDVNEPSLTPYIDAASSLIDDVVSCAADAGTTLSTAKLEVIERWLAAHFYAVSDQTYQMKRTADTQARYQGQTGMYLESTKYGQAAVSLDPTGCLKDLGAGNVARVDWLGLTPSEQTPYYDRE